jgi:tetratricopeptide (TPR) repeat protein
VKDNQIYIKEILSHIPARNRKLKSIVAPLVRRLKSNPRDYWAWDNLANLYFSEGFVLQSIDIFRRAIMIKRDLPVVRLRIGIAYYRLARLDSAIAELKKAVKLKPDLAMAHYYLGFAYYHKGESDLSLAHFKQVQKISPESCIVYYHMAEAYLQRRRFQDAVEVLEKLLKVSPSSATAWYKLGQAYRGLYRNMEAANALREALRHNQQDKRSESMLEMLTNVPGI